jgi:hypothetical protein
MIKTIPEVNMGELLKLVEKATPLFKREPSLIDIPLTKPVVFVGDVHGDSATTLEVLKNFPTPGFRRVFLGDYVDRSIRPLGSLETLSLILAEKIENPSDNVLLRGNHEFEPVYLSGTNNDFGAELRRTDIGNIELKDIHASFRTLFSQFPYVATTSNGILALHGGLPEVETLEELKMIPKGIHQDTLNPIISQTVWNEHLTSSQSSESQDPTLHVFGKARNLRRGALPMARRFVYNREFFNKKMSALGKKILLRGHSYDAKGFDFNDRILTIFTSQYYQDRGKLKGSYVAVLDPKKQLKTARDLEIVQL